MGLITEAPAQPLVAPRGKGVIDPSTGKPVGATDPFFVEIKN
jgi:NADH-quinone oxidoreductase subunit B